MEAPRVPRILASGEPLSRRWPPAGAERKGQRREKEEETSADLSYLTDLETERLELLIQETHRSLLESGMLSAGDEAGKQALKEPRPPGNPREGNGPVPPRGIGAALDEIDQALFDLHRTLGDLGEEDPLEKVTLEAPPPGAAAVQEGEEEGDLVYFGAEEDVAREAAAASGV